MNEKTIYLWLKNPYEPLFSDKCLLWLAGTYTGAGYKVKAVTGPVVPGPEEILLTNMNPKKRLPSSGGSILRLTSSTDLVNRLMRTLGYFYGKSRFFHVTTEEGGNAFIQKAIGLLKMPFQSEYRVGSSQPDNTSVETAERTVPEGRRIVFRVNMDWDERGLGYLERWCEKFPLHPTLAIAGNELTGRQRRVKSFVERFNVDLASHSLSHYIVLSSHNKQRQRREIFDNHRLLEDLFSRPVTGFVAPYGKYNKRTFELLEETGYRWFIRSWSVAPLPLAGFNLADLGVSFFFTSGWKKTFFERLALSDLVLQLHLPDLASLAEEFERVIKELVARGVRFVDCRTYYNETCSRDSR
ncbi:MAG TPA: polysaccharide deacetylase family protein [archaeon]|nr:polysaccharide deacetylase family protein [archaeon]